MVAIKTMMIFALVDRISTKLIIIIAITIIIIIIIMIKIMITSIIQQIVVLKGYVYNIKFQWMRKANDEFYPEKNPFFND